MAGILPLAFIGIMAFSVTTIVWAQAPEPAFDAQVNQDFIDVRTGPGRAYPVHQVVQKNDWLELVKQKTNWIYIESDKGIRGWLHSSELPNMKSVDGEAYSAGVTDLQPVSNYFEFGLNAGDFGGSQLLAGYGGYAFTPQIMLEATLGQAIGSFSTTYMIGGQVMHFAKPWKGLRPYGALGAGRVFVEASSRIRQPEDQDDDYLKSALGVRVHIDGRFYMKFEYGAYLV